MQECEEISNISPDKVLSETKIIPPETAPPRLFAPSARLSYESVDGRPFSQLWSWFGYHL